MTGDWDYINDEIRDIDPERRGSNRRLRRKQNRVDVNVDLSTVTDVDKTYRCWREGRVSVHPRSFSHLGHRRIVPEMIFVVLETTKISPVSRL